MDRTAAMTERPSLDTTLMASAMLWSHRSTCPRLNVGAVIAQNNGVIISSGYNGTAPGQPHCAHGPGGEPCEWAIHAEANAVATAHREGRSVVGSQLFSTHSPCLACAKTIVISGIQRVVFDVAYRSTEGLNFLTHHGIQVVRV